MSSSLKKAHDRSGWKPSPDQELLIGAALWQRDAAGKAWSDWTSRVNPTELNRGERRLLPLVYLNLRDSGLKPHDLEYLAEPYHYFKAHNQLVLRQAAAAVQSLQNAGVSTLLLKGMALIPLYYHDPGARPTRDIDILVPTAQAHDAIQVLYRAGWIPEDRSFETFDDAYINRHYSHTLKNAEEIQLDLHRHVLVTETRPDGDADFWSAAIPMSLEGVETSALNPADQLLHTCIHGSVWNMWVAPIRWVTDAYTLLQNTQVDWDRFLRQTEQRQVIMQVRPLLAYLRERFGAPVPATVIQSLNTMRASRWDCLQYEINVLPPTQHGAMSKIWYHVHQYRRLSPVYNQLQWHQRVPRFLRDTWGLQETREVPTYMGGYLLKSFERGMGRVAHAVHLPPRKVGT